MATRSQNGIPPYFLGDKGYPLFPWLMASHKEGGEVHLVLQLLCNRKHKKGRSIVENAFDILNKLLKSF